MMIRCSILALAMLAACSNDDECRGRDDETGRCCRLLPGVQGTIPTSSSSTVLTIDVAFDCPDLACAASDGLAAYCTQQCACAEDCPEGFSCESLPGATGSSKYCLRAGHVCAP